MCSRSSIIKGRHVVVLTNVTLIKLCIKISIHQLGLPISKEQWLCIQVSINMWFVWSNISYIQPHLRIACVEKTILQITIRVSKFLKNSYLPFYDNDWFRIRSPP